MIQINLKRQVDYFVQMVQKLKQQVGEGTANQLLSEAVYLFNIAGNDYVNLLQKNVKKLPVSNFKRNQRINMVIGNLTTHIKVRILLFILAFFHFFLSLICFTLFIIKFGYS